MDEQKKITTAAEFYGTESASKVVTLPSGLTVRIRKIHSREGMRADSPAFFRMARSISKPDPSDADINKAWANKSDEEKSRIIEINDNLVLTAVIEPKIIQGRAADATHSR